MQNGVNILPLLEGHKKSVVYTTLFFFVPVRSTLRNILIHFLESLCKIY